MDLIKLLNKPASIKGILTRTMVAVTLQSEGVDSRPVVCWGISPFLNEKQ